MVFLFDLLQIYSKNFFTFTKRLHKQATLYSAGHKYALFLAARVGSYPTGILLGVGVFI